MGRGRPPAASLPQQLAGLRQPSNLPTYRSIKVPSWVLANVKQAELALLQKGQRGLQEHGVLAPDTCPNCRAKLQALEIKYEFRRCTDCGYVQQDLTTTSNFWGGLVIGAGLALFFKALSGDEPPRRRPSRARKRKSRS